jgi:hypothetical protein
MSTRISSEDRGVIRRILIQVNEDPEYRAIFFKNPIVAMESMGLFFNDQAREEINILHEMFRDKLEQFSKMPSGYDPVITRLKEKEDIEIPGIEPIAIH